MEKYEYRFEAKVEKYDFGKYYYTIVWLPEEIATKLPFEKYPKLRIEAKVDGILLEGALMPDSGRWYLMVNKKILKRINKGLGDQIRIEFNIADQDYVFIPRGLSTALEEDLNFKQAWEKLTPGKKRGYAYLVSKAKSPEAIEKRISEIKEYIL